MDVRVKFLGGAQTVTGSKYLLEIDKYKLLIDCGLFQGLPELKGKNWEDLPIDAKEIDAVVLTHAHLDHSGYLPRLFKEGYNGPVYCTKPSCELLELLLTDSAKLQEEEAAYAVKKGYSVHSSPRPLYDSRDVEKVLPCLRGYYYDTLIRLTKDIKIRFRNASHILGAAIVEVYLNGETQKKKIVFSGDLGRNNDPILYPPTKIKEADILFIESTYGNKKNPVNNPEDNIAEIINTTITKGGCVLIPAFAIGRTQNILYYIKELLRKKKIPNLPIYMDSPMAISATKLYGQNYDFHKISLDELQNDNSFLQFNDSLNIINSHAASIGLNDIKKRAIIISASGMMNGGRVLHHLYNRLPRPKDTLLLVGFQAEGTRGRRISDGNEKIQIFGQEVEVKCRVAQINGLSAHADQTELMSWLGHFERSPKYTFIIHGEEEASRIFSYLIEKELKWNTVVPKYLQSFSLFKNI
jgi:metallo-beta-lactamase family protein